MSSDPAAKTGFLARMRARINRPGSWLSYDLGNLVPGRKIDAEVLDELETRLLTADVGVEATQHLVAGESPHQLKATGGSEPHAGRQLLVG